MLDRMKTRLAACVCGCELEMGMEMGFPVVMESHGIPVGMGMIISVRVWMLENALWKKIPIDIKFKAK